jgi:hypothetical protein
MAVSGLLSVLLSALCRLGSDNEGGIGAAAAQETEEKEGQAVFAAHERLDVRQGFGGGVGLGAGFDPLAEEGAIGFARSDADASFAADAFGLARIGLRPDVERLALLDKPDRRAHRCAVLAVRFDRKVFLSGECVERHRSPHNQKTRKDVLQVSFRTGFPACPDGLKGRPTGTGLADRAFEPVQTVKER